MNIKYSDSRMERILTSRRLIGKKYGHIQPSLENRLSELRAARYLADITCEPPPRRHKLTGDYDGCWSVSVSKNWRIVLQPIGDFDLNDLTTITAMKIISIEDYH